MGKMSDIIDRVEIAIATGHGAAVNLQMAVIDGFDQADAALWTSFGAPLEEGRDPVLELGRYVCSRADPVAGETLFRKAAELGIHQREPGSWPALDREDRLTYDLFAFVTRTVFDRLAPQAAPDLAAPAARPALEDTIFERLEGGGDRDEHRVAALEAPAEPKPKRERKAKAPPASPDHQEPQQPDPGQPADPAEQQPPPAPPPADAAPLSIGEAPLDPAKQVKKPHGGRRTKKADKAGA